MEEIKITASEARKIAEESINTSNLNTLKTIENDINCACLNNEFHIYYYNDYFSNSVINHLKNRGFQIEDLSTQREGACFKISW